jgi:hypothetical protein
VEVRRFRPHRLVRILLCAPPLAAVIAGFFEPGLWLALPIAMIPLVRALRDEVLVTSDELVIRTLVGSTRIRRHDVERAQYDYKPLGAFLEIHRRDGRIQRFMRTPKLTSTELSGDPPPRDSLAYQVTRWAETGELPD